MSTQSQFSNPVGSFRSLHSDWHYIYCLLPAAEAAQWLHLTIDLHLRARTWQPIWQRGPVLFDIPITLSPKFHPLVSPVSYSPLILVSLTANVEYEQNWLNRPPSANVGCLTRSHQPTGIYIADKSLLIRQDASVRAPYARCDALSFFTESLTRL